MRLQCLVLGGGVGERMRPATETRPKPLLRVAGEPFVVHQLRWLAAEGVTDVVYSIGYLGHLIRRELDGRDDLGCSVRFVDDGPTLVGTGGAVRRAVDEGALDATFFVLYGDSYLQLDLPRRGRHVRALRRGGADDRVPQRRRLGHEQRRVRRSPGRSVRQGVSPSQAVRHALHRLRLVDPAARYRFEPCANWPSERHRRALPRAEHSRGDSPAMRHEVASSRSVRLGAWPT